MDVLANYSQQICIAFSFSWFDDQSLLLDFYRSPLSLPHSSMPVPVYLSNKWGRIGTPLMTSVQLYYFSDLPCSTAHDPLLSPFYRFYQKSPLPPGSQQTFWVSSMAEGFQLFVATSMDTLSARLWLAFCCVSLWAFSTSSPSSIYISYHFYWTY